ncbi:hypothetical protein JCM8097_003052 [Rhodosporidiobolus ruineniae]
MVLTTSPTEARKPSVASKLPTSSSSDPAPPPPPPAHDHLDDLRRIVSVKAWKSGLAYYAKRSTPISFVNFVFRNLKTWVWGLVLSPATVFQDPLGTVASLIIYPVVWTALGVLVFFFWLGSKVGGQRILDWLSVKYAGGWSVVNWANPQIFGPSSVKAVEEAREYLTGEASTTQLQQVSITEANPDFTELKTVRLFSLPIARTLLLMSSLVYERRDRDVRLAADLAFKAQQNYDPESDEFRRAMELARDTLAQSEEPIKKQAAQWGLEFDGISELTTVAGPFASIFYTPFKSDEKPFVCLVFKGTTPSNFAEFLVDATIARVGSSVFFGAGSGSAHQGFYTDLFMTNDSSSTRSDGYGSIIRTLRHVATRMKQEWPGKDVKIPLWVAGHSLGSALASLCYARLLRSPDDLGHDLELKDCYAFGTPRLGDGAFASAFEESLVTPLDRPNILWRVANHKDIVTRVPPGLADPESNRDSLPTRSVLNYAFLGPAVRLFPSLAPLHRAPWYKLEELGAFHELTEVRVVDYEEEKDGEGSEKGDWAGWRRRSARWRSVDEAKGTNPLRLVLALLPSMIYDHLPNSYLQHLNNVETTVEQVAREREERREGGRPGLVKKARVWGALFSEQWEKVKEEAMPVAREMQERRMKG